MAFLQQGRDPLIRSSSRSSIGWPMPQQQQRRPTSRRCAAAAKPSSPPAAVAVPEPAPQLTQAQAQELARAQERLDALVLALQQRPRPVSRRAAQRGAVRLFLDSANVAAWEQYADSGVLYGVTTNPTILERAGVPCTLAAARQLARAARQLRFDELQLQAWGGGARELEACAERLLDVDGDLVTIKLPCTPDGLAAAAALSARHGDAGVRLTVTAVYSAAQALAAQAAGADYAAPYLGRIADAHPDGLEGAIREVGGMQRAAAATRSSMRILVASIREAAHMARLAGEFGADTFTFGEPVMRELVAWPASAAAAAEFERAARRQGGDESFLAL